MKEIKNFLPEVSSIRELFHGDMTRENALSLVAFNNSFPSAHDVEEGIIDLLSKFPKEHTDTILKRLYTELDTIVTLYECSRKSYDQMHLSVLWERFISYYKEEIKTQEDRTIEAYDELKEAKKSYNTMLSNGIAKYEIDVLKRRKERLDAEHLDQQTKLANLHSECKKLEKEMLSVPDDIFRQIYNKCFNLIMVVEDHCQKPVKETNDKDREEASFLSPSILDRVYNFCNGELFEKMSCVDFCMAFNLHPNSKKLVVRNRKKVKVSFIIRQLSLKIDNPDKRGKWTDGILSAASIDKEYYDKKNGNLLSKSAGKKSKKFVEEFMKILG